MEKITTQVTAESLHAFIKNVFHKLGENEENAGIIANVLIAADLRGIDSHGAARVSFYADNIDAGVILPDAPRKVVSETATTAVVDAGGGMGHVASYHAMRMAIEKAKTSGLGLVAVKNSNHFGIAGYYAMLALEQDCIGMAMTNSWPYVSPTFARDAMLGTNPIAVAVPAGEERPFVLDMATNTVRFGKVEIYTRLEKPMPLGWATDENGIPSQDAPAVLENMHKIPVRGGLSPLGGDGELLGGHKGYGLGLLVDILCAVLPGALTSMHSYPTEPDGKKQPSGLGHIFGAVRVDAFRPLVDFKSSMDELEKDLRQAPKAAGQDRIYIHGEKEYEHMERRSKEGIPLNNKVIAELKRVAKAHDIEFHLE